MDDEPFKLDASHMQKLAVERSKLWAELFNKTTQQEEDEVYDIENLDDLYNDENEEKDSSNSEDCEDMAEECDPLECEDLNETSNQNVMTIAKNIAECSNALGIIAQINKGFNDTGNVDINIQRVLEETLPIVEEYRRYSRDSGFEVVLSTFDLGKIEEKVESWKRQNDSALSLSCSSPEQYRTDWGREYYKKPKFFSGYEQQQSNHYESDSDSLHSVETARYIRSSRVHKKVSTTTTTIKSYRLVESKRNELRRKYAYLINDDTMRMFPKKCYQQPKSKYEIPKKYPSDIHRIDKSIRRIPQRRLRRCHKSNLNSSNSSSEEESIESDKKLKPLCYSRGYHGSNRRLTCMRQIQYSNENDELELPYMNEAECTCKGSDRLCEKARHLANSSSEGWLVENCESPLKTLPEVEVAETKTKTNNISDEFPTCKVDIKEENANKTKIIKKGKGKKLTKNNKKEECNEKQPQEEDSSFESNLKLALKLSKKEYEKELKKKKNKNETNSLDCKLKERENNDENTLEKSHAVSKLSSQLEHDLKMDELIDNEKPANSKLVLGSKPKRNCNSRKRAAQPNFLENISLSSSLSETPSYALEDKSDAIVNELSNKVNSKKPPKITKMAESINKKAQTKKLALKAIAEESDASPLITKANNNEILKEEVNCTYNSTDYTALFTNFGNLCNSTALVNNNTATTRQLALKTPAYKNDHNLRFKKSKNSDSNDNKNNKTKDLKDNKLSIPMLDLVQDNHIVSTEPSDCAIISSTTDTNLQITQIPKHKTTNKANNTILLYSPTKPSLAPPHSISNGQFKLTEEHLASHLGQKIASKFMKYYVGQKCFKESSTVYYIPPKPDTINNSSDSEIDFLDLCLRYGKVVEERKKL